MNHDLDQSARLLSLRRQRLLALLFVTDAMRSLSSGLPKAGPVGIAPE
jgi:hypothetical protein